jgi:hypothetical protein
MPPAEALFWISLFGIDVEVSLVMPKRWKWPVGIALTALSIIGFSMVADVLQPKAMAGPRTSPAVSFYSRG